MEEVQELAKFVSQLDNAQVNAFLVQMPVDIICKFEAMNDGLASFCQNEELWKAKVTQDYVDAAASKPSQQSWREYYMQLHAQE